MNQGEHNGFSECGWFVCFSADIGTQVDLENPVFLSSTSYTYDRLGRQLTAIAAGVSTNLYAYSRYGQLTNEVVQNLSASAPQRETIARAYDALGRSTDFSLGDGYAVAYAYDTYGRFKSVESAQSADVFEYSYLPGSSLISGMTVSSGHSWSRSYEPERSLITAVENRFGNTVISRFDYVNDEIGRRISRADSGLAFANPAFDVYSYNARSEVIGAQRYHGTNPADTSRPYGGRGFGYDYDPIGNRLSATETIGGETLAKSYTANGLNQYTAIANPDAVGLRGSATNTATVTVNGNAVSRDNIVAPWTPWHYALPADNANGGVFTFAEIMAAINPQGTNAPDIVSTASGNVYAPPRAEALTYDDDGNLLNDGRWQYTWNGENRLVCAEEQVCPTNRTLLKVEYAYDHQGRMVWKEIKHRGAEAQSWEEEKETSYLWDNFNIIAETTVADSVTNTTYNVWGLDLDGTLQGAGGVGGLLAVVKDSATYVPAWDANGNIKEYIAEDGAIVAHREYDPFGGSVVVTGNADDFTHWFSTKPWCAVTALGEYQYRKYSPVLGRWLSRDPFYFFDIYLITRNNAVNGYDYIGLAHIDNQTSGTILVIANYKLNSACIKWLDEKKGLKLSGGINGIPMLLANYTKSNIMAEITDVDGYWSVHAPGTSGTAMKIRFTTTVTDKNMGKAGKDVKSFSSEFLGGATLKDWIDTTLDKTYREYITEGIKDCECTAEDLKNLDNAVSRGRVAIASFPNAK